MLTPCPWERHYLIPTSWFRCPARSVWFHSCPQVRVFLLKRRWEAELVVDVIPSFLSGIFWGPSNPVFWLTSQNAFQPLHFANSVPVGSSPPFLFLDVHVSFGHKDSGAYNQLISSHICSPEMAVAKRYHEKINILKQLKTLSTLINSEFFLWAHVWELRPTEKMEGKLSTREHPHFWHQLQV